MLMYFLFEWKLNVNVNAIDILLFASRDSAKLRLYFLYYWIRMSLLFFGWREASC